MLYKMKKCTSRGFGVTLLITWPQWWVAHNLKDESIQNTVSEIYGLNSHNEVKFTMMAKYRKWNSEMQATTRILSIKY